MEKVYRSSYKFKETILVGYVHNSKMSYVYIYCIYLLTRDGLAIEVEQYYHTYIYQNFDGYQLFNI